jgi:hypothetical protein
MEFRGKFHGINSMKFHGIFHGFPWKNFMKKNPSNVYEKCHGIPWNFMENSMEFHETEVDGIPWNCANSRNFMEFGFDRDGKGSNSFINFLNEVSSITESCFVSRIKKYILYK